MQKKSISRSAFFSPRVLLAVFLCGAACSIATGTLLGFFRGEGSHRALTFAERVAYQRAIEDVYWRHRIWPKERPDSKPSLGAVMSQAQLEKKVADYLRKSQALEDYWQRPLTAEQLRAEMDRMAKHTKQTEVLRELFAALGNDPFIIAECLARPALADRLLANWYAYDQRIHTELTQRVQAELNAHPTIAQFQHLTGSYTEIELVKSNRAHKQANGYPALAVNLNGREWKDTVQKLAGVFNTATDKASNHKQAVAGRSFPSTQPTVSADTGLPLAEVSKLQEDVRRY